MENLIKKYESLGFHLSVKEEPIIVGYCVRKVSKARFKKPLFNYRFRSIERMVEFCNEWIERIERNINAENERKSIKKAAMSNMNHSFEVGNVIYNSWGWEQTNIDFYEIVEVKPKSIVIRRISKMFPENQKGNINSMAGYVAPMKGHYIGEPELKKINVSVSYNGNISYYIKAEHGCFCEYANSESGVYSSWYA